MDEQIEQVFDTGPQAEVSVENVRGSISVESWDEPRVEVRAVKHGERGRVVLLHEGQRVEARTEVEPREAGFLAWFGGDEPAEVHYTLRVPRASQVRARIVNGPLRVSGIQGVVEGRGVNGSVHIAQVNGAAVVHTANGLVELTDVCGRVEAQTANGAVAIRGGRLEAIAVETVNGPINIEPLSAGSQVNAKTVNGGLTLTLADGAGAALDASGVVLHASFDVPHTATHTGRTVWRGVVGQGEPTAQVSYRTVNGSLRVTSAVGTAGAPVETVAAPASAAAPPLAPPPAPPPPPHAAPVEAVEEDTAIGVMMAEGDIVEPVVAAPATPPPPSATRPAPPQDVMGILAAIDRGELSVEDGLRLIKQVNQG